MYCMEPMCGLWSSMADAKAASPQVAGVISWESHADYWLPMDCISVRDIRGEGDEGGSTLRIITMIAALVLPPLRQMVALAHFTPAQRIQYKNATRGHQSTARVASVITNCDAKWRLDAIKVTDHNTTCQ